MFRLVVDKVRSHSGDRPHDYVKSRTKRVKKKYKHKFKSLSPGSESRSIEPLPTRPARTICTAYVCVLTPLSCRFRCYLTYTAKAGFSDLHIGLIAGIVVDWGRFQRWGLVCGKHCLFELCHSFIPAAAAAAALHCFPFINALWLAICAFYSMLWSRFRRRKSEVQPRQRAQTPLHKNIYVILRYFGFRCFGES